MQQNMKKILLAFAAVILLIVGVILIARQPIIEKDLEGDLAVNVVVYKKHKIVGSVLIGAAVIAGFFAYRMPNTEGITATEAISKFFF